MSLVLPGNPVHTSALSISMGSVTAQQFVEISGQRTIDVVAFEVALEILAERCRTVRGGNPKGATALRLSGLRFFCQ